MKCHAVISVSKAWPACCAASYLPLVQLSYLGLHWWSLRRSQLAFTWPLQSNTRSQQKWPDRKAGTLVKARPAAQRTCSRAEELTLFWLSYLVMCFFHVQRYGCNREKPRCGSW